LAKDDDNPFVWGSTPWSAMTNWKLVFRSEAEMETSSNDFETLENQFALQKPISNFFDAAVACIQHPDRRARPV